MYMRQELRGAGVLAGRLVAHEELGEHLTQRFIGPVEDIDVGDAQGTAGELLGLLGNLAVIARGKEHERHLAAGVTRAVANWSNVSVCSLTGAPTRGVVPFLAVKPACR